MMEENKTITNSNSFVLASKAKDYFALIKFTLSFMVVFSSVICYLLSPNVEFDLLQVLLLFVGGILVTGSANAINQILEKDTDAIMKRTAGRPVASTDSIAVRPSRRSPHPGPSRYALSK